jgi:hypothetical protein
LQFQLRNQAKKGKEYVKKQIGYGYLLESEQCGERDLRLKDSGFSHTDVSVLLPENLGSKELATEKGSDTPSTKKAGTGY